MRVPRQMRSAPSGAGGFGCPWSPDQADERDQGGSLHGAGARQSTIRLPFLRKQLGFYEERKIRLRRTFPPAQVLID
jgi:hypothetical protein